MQKTTGSYNCLLNWVTGTQISKIYYVGSSFLSYPCNQFASWVALAFSFFLFFFLLWCNQFTHELSSPSMKRKQKKAYNNTKTATKKNAGTANNSSIQNDSLNRRLPSSKTLVYKVTLRNTERRSWKHGNGHRHMTQTLHGHGTRQFPKK